MRGGDKDMETKKFLKKITLLHLFLYILCFINSGITDFAIISLEAGVVDGLEGKFASAHSAHTCVTAHIIYFIIIILFYTK